MANVLYITNDGLTDPLGQSQIIPYLQALSGEHNIHILACEKANAYKKNSENVRGILNQSGIGWARVAYRNKPAVISSWLMQREVKKEAGKIIKRKNIDIIHCRSYPASITGMSLSEKFNIPFIFDMRGFWADERVDRHIWNKKNPVFLFLYNYFKRKEKKLLAAASHIITLTTKAKDILIEKYNVESNKISVIPCAADLKFFKPQKSEVRKKYRNALGLHDNEKLLMYMGSVGSCYLLKEMLLFYKAGKNLIPGLKMAVFSSENNHSFIKETAASIGIKEEELICKFLPRRELVKYLSAVDYSVMFFEKSFSIQGSSPTKHGELLGMNIPVVLNSGVGDLEDIVKEKNTGYVVKNFSEQEFDKAYRYLETMRFSQEDFIFIAEKYYSLEKAVDSLNVIYKKLAIK